jgi:hypothetical protein
MIALAGCSLGRAPEIRVLNASTSVLHQVVFHGDGFRKTIERIDPGQTIKLIVRPARSTGLNMDVPTPVGYVSAAGLAYFDSRGGYYVQITITPDYKIASSSEIRTLF